MKKTISTAVWSALVLIGASVSTTINAAPILINGSFENPDILTQSALLNGAAIPGWRVGGGPFSVNEAIFLTDEALAVGTSSPTSRQTPFGRQWMQLSQGGAGFLPFIEQTVAGFVVGGVYKIDFAMSSLLTSSVIEVQVDIGTTNITQNFRDDSGGTNCGIWCNWKNKSFQFTATDTMATLRFAGRSISNSKDDPGLDNVSLTEISVPSSIPEPTTLAILGLGLVGLSVMRRRRLAWQ